MRVTIAITLLFLQVYMCQLGFSDEYVENPAIFSDNVVYLTDKEAAYLGIRYDIRSFQDIEDLLPSVTVEISDNLAEKAANGSLFLGLGAYDVSGEPIFIISDYRRKSAKFLVDPNYHLEMSLTFQEEFRIASPGVLYVYIIKGGVQDTEIQDTEIQRNSGHPQLRRPGCIKEIQDTHNSEDQAAAVTDRVLARQK